jgi:hypothetical protein
MATRREAVHFLEAAGGPTGRPCFVRAVEKQRRSCAVATVRTICGSEEDHRSYLATGRHRRQGDTSRGGNMWVPRRFGATVHHQRSSFDSTERATIRTGFRGREELGDGRRWLHREELLANDSAL